MTLTSAYVSGMIGAGGMFEAVNSYTFADNATSSAGELVQSKSTEQYTYDVAGAVTLDNGSYIGDGIYGYGTVKLTDTNVDDMLSAGKGGFKVTNSMSITEKNGLVTAVSSRYYQESSNAAGTLNASLVRLPWQEVRHRHASRSARARQMPFSFLIPSCLPSIRPP